jgi:hypothetical protein
MPTPLYTQNVIAFIWDFDKTLTHGYMQEPLFEAYGVDALTFWREVNALKEHYSSRDLRISSDSAYLGHILRYVEEGVFAGLTNQRLQELGAAIRLAPGVPEFFASSKESVTADPRYSRHDIKVEHYVVSTGLRKMIEGSALADHVEGIWACELLADPPGPGYLASPAPTPETEGIVTQLGYVIDNTTKTRAIFEINKGVNKDDNIDVNTLIAPEDRRVPIKNMIYVADGPSDVPSFSVINQNGGKTLGVYCPGSDAHYDAVASLEEQGRVQSIAEADYQPGKPAHMWLMRSLKKIADEVCAVRERTSAELPGAPGHVVN